DVGHPQRCEAGLLCPLRLRDQAVERGSAAGQGETNADAHGRVLLGRRLWSPATAQAHDSVSAPFEHTCMTRCLTVQLCCPTLAAVWNGKGARDRGAESGGQGCGPGICRTSLCTSCAGVAVRGWPVVSMGRMPTTHTVWRCCAARLCKPTRV